MKETIIKCDHCGAPGAVELQLRGPYQMPAVAGDDDTVTKYVDLCPKHAADLTYGLSKWVPEEVTSNIVNLVKNRQNLRVL